MMAGFSPKLLLLPGLLMALSAASPPAPITIDYPQEGSIFPPEITPPTWLWRDAGKSVTFWRIEFSFGDGGPEIQGTSRGARPRIGRIDPDCVADTNRAPALTPELSAAHTWTPDRAMWQAIKRRSAAIAATVTITGFRGEALDRAVSRGRVAIRTSTDPVGAPIFYRDVPLMPSELEKGVIKPLAAEAVPLVAWRIRNVGDERSRVVMDNLPLCANCHSFSADGKTMGMDLDGLQNNRGMYILAPVAREMAIRKQDLIQWSSPAGKLKGNVRIGFMSQVSPDGQYVATTVNPAAMAGGTAEPSSNYYVANFKDYRFLQVFYPTRGILSWYSRRTGVLLPLPGADDSQFVQMGAVWSPDGKYLVFARAGATDPDRPGAPPAQFADDPNELQLQYDLYRIPFRDGRGGVPEPIAGASRNGMSNYLPKSIPGRAMDRLREVPQRAVDASRQPVIHRAGGRRNGAAHAVQHGPHELVAQLLAQRPMDGFLVQRQVALHADVSHAHRPGRQRQSADSDRERNRGQSGGEYSGVREHPAGWFAPNRRAGDRLLPPGE
ncbi:MAG: hypothetical protein ABSC93_11750 [Bryobacteraceae bacterium]|jgi:hypothetical protein